LILRIDKGTSDDSRENLFPNEVTTNFVLSWKSGLEQRKAYWLSHTSSIWPISSSRSPCQKAFLISNWNKGQHFTVGITGYKETNKCHLCNGWEDFTVILTTVLRGRLLCTKWDRSLTLNGKVTVGQYISVTHTLGRDSGVESLR